MRSTPARPRWPPACRRPPRPRRPTRWPRCRVVSCSTPACCATSGSSVSPDPGSRAASRRRHVGYTSPLEAAMRVLVTGAASGIGRATCLRLARDARASGKGAQVAAVDVGPSPGLDRLVEELRTLGAEALPLQGDMATADAPARVVDEAVKRFGGLEGLVSNAGVNRPGPLAQYSVA